MRKYLKMGARLLLYTFAGAAAGAAAGYLLGAAGGLLVTFYNNNFLQETAPMGSYIWWAKFCGYLGTVFATLPCAAGGAVVGLIKILKPRVGASAA